MPFDKSRYPADWPQISLARREYAGWKCEWCKAPNGESIVRVPGGFYAVVEIDEVECEQEVVWFDKHGHWLQVGDVAAALSVPLDPSWGPDCLIVPDCRVWQSKVILTVAHLGTQHPDGRPGDKHDKMDVRPENLAALCQNCHLSYDLADHIAHARETRMKRKAAGSLFDVFDFA